MLFRSPDSTPEEIRAVTELLRNIDRLDQGEDGRAALCDVGGADTVMLGSDKLHHSGCSCPSYDEPYAADYLLLKSQPADPVFPWVGGVAAVGRESVLIRWVDEKQHYWAAQWSADQRGQTYPVDTGDTGSAVDSGDTGAAGAGEAASRTF